MSHPLPPSLTAIANTLAVSYEAHPQTAHFGETGLPSRARMNDLLGLLRRIAFPGFHEHHPVTRAQVQEHLNTLLLAADALLNEQIRQSLRYAACEKSSVSCDAEARRLCDAFWTQMPEIRRLLATDVQAAFDGDPAASHTDETIFCYPGVEAVFVHRIAHALFNLGIPMMPRIMSEIAHAATGADIHPGAQISESFFIDHATGVVIGGTAVIGKRVKIYQCVTLGAISTRGGQSLRDKKRHPTLEDDVTVYSNSTVLGGRTVIGERSVIAGGAFVTESVPPDHTVIPTRMAPELLSKRPLDTDMGAGI